MLENTLFDTETGFNLRLRSNPFLTFGTIIAEKF
jgi:hypothetical protein